VAGLRDDDAYGHLDLNGQLYEFLKRFSDPVVITLVLSQQLRSAEYYGPSCAKPPAFSPIPSRRGRPRLFLFFPSQRPQAKAIFLEPLRRTVVAELLGEPETLLIDSSLLLLSAMHPMRFLNLGASEAHPG